jgi:hypothetical protein
VPELRAYSAAVRAGVVLAAIALLAAPATAAEPSYWSVGKVLQRLDGATIRVGSRPVRVHSATTLCAGVGRAIRSKVRRWHSFACTYTTFTKGGVDRDVDFRVYALTRRRFAVAGAHWIAALP